MADVLTMSKKPSSKHTPYNPTKLIAEQKIHGGKNYLVRRIFALAPKGMERFLDAYGGTGTMTYNAPLGLKRRVFNDINHFRCLSKVVVRDHCDLLVARLKEMTYSEPQFGMSKEWVERHKDVRAYAVQVDKSVEAVAHWLAMSKMSRGGLGTAYSWSERTRGKRSVGGSKPEQLNNWLSMIERLPLLSANLTGVECVSMEAAEIMHMAILDGDRGSPWFIYLDPPYPKDTRSGNGKEYGDNEMTLAQHTEMLRVAKTGGNCQIAISSYHNPLYDEALKDWKRVEFNMANHSGQGKDKERRVEVLYMNY